MFEDIGRWMLKTRTVSCISGEGWHLESKAAPECCQRSRRASDGRGDADHLLASPPSQLGLRLVPYLVGEAPEADYFGLSSHPY